MSTGNQRNNLCPCGSGKKYKKCCLNKKPRTTSITMDMGKPVVANGLRISPMGSFELLQDGVPLKPVEAYHDVNYEREKGPKILNKTPLNPDNLITDPNIALGNFDRIFAIDTNTKMLKDEIISVSCIVLCYLTHNPNDTLDAKFAAVHCLEFRNIQCLAENIAWMKMIQLITANPAYNSSLKLGIIVDSDLRNIPAYNNRSKPIFSDFYLPRNIELIYASADVGKEYLANKLILLCENEVNKLLSEIILGKVANDNLQEVKNEPYTHIRIWNA